MFFCILRIKETSPHPENKQGAEHTRQRAGRKIGPQSMILTIQDKHNSPKLAGRRIRALSCRHAPIRKPMQPTQLTCHNSPKMAARRIRVLSCRHAPIRKPHCPLATIPRNWPVEEFGCSRVPTHRSETQSNEQYPHTMSPTTLTPSHDAHSI